MSKKAKWIIAVISAVVILIVGFAITKAVIANIEEKKAQEEYEKARGFASRFFIQPPSGGRLNKKGTCKSPFSISIKVL